MAAHPWGKEERSLTSSRSNHQLPNILMIITHDTGRHLGCYGRKVDTPNLDRLAGEGARFDSYFCPAPQCSPSRGSILTGRYPHINGLMGLAHLGFGLNPGEKTLPMFLREAGYDTYLFGFQHEAQDPASLGYDHIAQVKWDHRAQTVAPQVVDFLRNWRKETPFFAMVGFTETHRPFDRPWYTSDDPDRVEVPPYLPDLPDIRRDIAEFQGTVRAADDGVGLILEALDTRELAENTLVIYTTDHGIAFPRAKGTLYDPGLETALLMRWLGNIRPGSVYRELLCNIDLLPTLLDIACIRAPENLDGRSFLPLLRGLPYAGRERLFCELTWHDLYRPMRGIRTRRYKFIRHFTQACGIYIPLDIHQGLSGRAVRQEFYSRPYVQEELYDLDKDPLEMENLIGDPAYQETVQELRQVLEQWMRQTDDPLLSGHIRGQEAPGWEEERALGNLPREAYFEG